MGEPAKSPPPPEIDWLIDIKRGLSEPPTTSSSWSICKVPIPLRLVNEDAYTPHIVSIGPIHHKAERTLPMEDHKKRYLISFFQRTKNPEAIVDVCYNDLLNVDEKVRACYLEPILYDKHELAKILLHDAVFMLEVFMRYATGEYMENDPILTTGWIMSTLHRDLVLLENQIPFFVLNSMFTLASPTYYANHSARSLALRYLDSLLVIGQAIFKKSGEHDNHLLHLLYKCYLPPDTLGSSIVAEWDSVHCATSLTQAGVVFQKSTDNDLFDIQFHNGTFKIPPLSIYESTDSIFRNLVAFEQCQRDSTYYITSYMRLMDTLIDTPNDVELLQREGIIVNYLGNGKNVSNLFNNMCKEISWDNFYFAELCCDVNAYAESPWHHYIAAARRDYFKNPWSIISFLAAVILIVLTLLQTLYTLLSYYQG
ncbi:UPF0481 protein At3g47200-like [Tripterygium wilfordii]|uniref:UPF0481 protein At3g47200-like n=1 Tax=Tripterygium wilfordii TaxID=458696 RepID=UPI0018F83452|nr:UPF0481 protein At3g47200-like [Tripterygium wilfordii]